MTRHATYVTAEDFLGERVTFRAGLPTDWDTAQARWLRLDDARRGRGLMVRWQGRIYAAHAVEVREVDRHGRGLGSDRHGQAFTVPCRSFRFGRPRSYPWVSRERRARELADRQRRMANVLNRARARQAAINRAYLGTLREAS